MTRAVLVIGCALALVGLLVGCDRLQDTAIQVRARVDLRAWAEISGVDVAPRVGPRGGIRWTNDQGDPDGMHLFRACLRGRGYRANNQQAGPGRWLRATIKAEAGETR